jgi:D-alanyl-D-alanine carboxypeptidase (penicillin-binding protein 5/6)
MSRSRATRRLLSVLAGALLASVSSVPAGAQQSAPPRAYVVVDADTGEVLAASAAHEPVPPASTVKIMTALAAVERLAPDAVITVSDLAAGVPASADNPIRMQPGERWRLQDALAVLLLASGNDAAYAIAEAAGGSLDGFAQAMASTAERYGMGDSTFNDPAGFSDAVAYDGGPKVSAFDLAIAARNAMEVPQLALLAASTEATIETPGGSTRTIANHNKLLPGLARAYTGATGFKTGYTALAGHTLVATAERGGRRLVAVVLGTYDTYGWAAVLLDQGFATAPGAGTGETLPEVAVSEWSARRADLAGFAALARGRVVPAGATAGVAGFVTQTTSSAGRPTTDLQPAPVTRGASDDGGPVSVRTALLGTGGLLAALVALRRRAVRRQRARRLARRRAMAAAMRRGALPVVDGRYRPGTRVGPPVDSHVRLHRLERPPPHPLRPASPAARPRASNGAGTRTRAPR